MAARSFSRSFSRGESSNCEDFGGLGEASASGAPRKSSTADMQALLGRLELTLCRRLDNIEKSLQRLHADAAASKSEAGPFVGEGGSRHGSAHSPFGPAGGAPARDAEAEAGVAGGGGGMHGHPAPLTLGDDAGAAADGIRARGFHGGHPNEPDSAPSGPALPLGNPPSSADLALQAEEQWARTATPSDKQPLDVPLRTEWKDGVLKADIGPQRCHSQKDRMSSKRVYYVGMPSLPRSQDDIYNQEEKPNRCLLRPSSQIRLAWDVATIMIIVHDMAVVPITIAFNTGGNIVSSFLFWPFLVFWTFDMPLSFMTGYYRPNGSLEMSPRQIALGYMRTWFFLDLFMLASTWSEVLISQTSAGYLLGRAGKSMRILRIMRSLRLLRLGKLRRISEAIMDNITSRYHHIFMSVAAQILMIVWLNHFIACSWWGLGVGVSDGGRHDSWTSHNKLEQAPLGLQYFTALHWSLTQFTPAGMEVNPRNLPERIFSVVVLLFAMVAFSSFVSSITQSMTALRELHSRSTRNMAALRRYLQAHDVPQDLMCRITYCADYRVLKQAEEIQEAQVEFLKFLSKPLKRELSSHIFAPALARHPFFDQFGKVDKQAMNYLCLEAVMEMYLATEDLLFTQGFRGDHMYFLRSGQFGYQRGAVDVNNPSDSESLGDLASMLPHDRTYDVMFEQGEWCCEISIWCPWRHAGTMVANVMSEVLAVEAASFIRTAKSYQTVTEFACIYATLFHQELREQYDEVDDMTLFSLDTFKQITYEAQQRHLEAVHFDTEDANSARSDSKALSADDGTQSTIQTPATPTAQQPPHAGADAEGPRSTFTL